MIFVSSFCSLVGSCAWHLLSCSYSKHAPATSCKKRCRSQQKMTRSEACNQNAFKCTRVRPIPRLVFLHEKFGMMLCCQLQILGHAQIVSGYICLWPSTVFANRVTAKMSRHDFACKKSMVFMCAAYLLGAASFKPQAVRSIVSLPDWSAALLPVPLFRLRIE